MRRGVLQAAFLAPQGRSKRLCGAGCGDGAGARRERWARGRAYRGGSGRARRGFRRGADAWPGGMRRRLPQAAFLVSRLLNHSRFPDGRKYRRSVRCRAQPLYLLTPARSLCAARNSPQGTRFPSRLWTFETLARCGLRGWCGRTAHAAGLLTGRGEHSSCGIRRRLPQAAFLAHECARNAYAVCVRRKDGPCHSERRVGMGPARKRAATKKIPRTA